MNHTDWMIMTNPSENGSKNGNCADASKDLIDELNVVRRFGV